MVAEIQARKDGDLNKDDSSGDKERWKDTRHIFSFLNNNFTEI